jgi:hypothetical protein
MKYVASTANFGPYLLHTGFFFGLFVEPEDENVFLQNVL